MLISDISFLKSSNCSWCCSSKHLIFPSQRSEGTVRQRDSRRSHRPSSRSRFVVIAGGTGLGGFHERHDADGQRGHDVVVVIQPGRQSAFIVGEVDDR